MKRSLRAWSLGVLLAVDLIALPVLFGDCHMGAVGYCAATPGTPVLTDWVIDRTGVAIDVGPVTLSADWNPGNRN